MRRAVFYDGRSRVAAAAAATLASEFDVRELPAGAELAPEPAVVLLEQDRPGLRRPNVRVIGLVASRGRGPWPDHWHAVLPRGVGRAMLARTIANAFADVAARLEIERLGRELGDLNAIGIRLSAERQPDTLLELILTKAREITESDAGSLYLVEETPQGERHLFFALAQNDSIEIPFRATRLPLTSASVAGHVALTGIPINLEDAYDPPAGSPFRINRSFDETAGYRTQSMLVVPMRTPQGETIGVLQLINCRPGFGGRLGGAAEVERHVRPFSARYERLAASLASQAAVALDNNRLYQNIRRLFDGFVGAAVTAIESRDPTTSGHSFRVAELTTGLAGVVDRCEHGRFAAIRISDEEMMELRYAALLHDFGKVGVREHVLLKAKKLYPGELDRIRQRVAFIKRGLELRCGEHKLAYLVEKGHDRFDEHAAALDAELAARLAELDEGLERVVVANEPTVLPRDVMEQIQQLARRTYEDHLGDLQTIITPQEAEILAIARGSLTEAEIAEIRSHVVHTFQFLTQIPWTKEFQRVPEIARSHHEKLDGSGYPYGMKADEIPLPSKIMTIADIFDALTAGDRPYKNSVSVERALDILHAEGRAGALDPDLLDLFVTARVFELTRWRS